MKKIVASIALAALMMICISGCTENQRARSLGGTMKYSVPADKMFVNVTWKDETLWVLTTKREPGHEPKTYYFDADTNFGLLEGHVIITEAR